ncbi:MAG: exopolyphosphatase, partial [Planctomycetota bacterium]
MTPPAKKTEPPLDETPLADPPATVAAVDLGSNSFHMIMAQLFPGEVRVIDRQRERVRLAGGLQPDRSLDEDCRKRALDCLHRFGEQLKRLPLGHVRAVGTNTFRKAKDAAKFTAECEAALGHPIDVISGIEEARLVYLGVVHTSPPRAGRRLVIDIGGGSTEVIVGDGTEVVEAESLGLGCVTYTHRFFPDGELTAKRFDEAITAARVELRPYSAAFGPDRWDTCLGSSGTAHAIERIVLALGRD